MTLIECVGASLILAVIAVAAVRTSAGAATAQALSSRRATGMMLAESLLAEIERKAYIDPANPTTLGRDAGESSTDKTTFDDVDDYNGWSESPPRDSTGAPIPGMADWARTVAVAWSDMGPLSPDVSGNTGMKSVAVSVYFKSRLVCELQSLRAPD
ncbi:MAG: hypothetical protein ACK58T_19360 [Phycisphaerae bacterium]|jgi:hypothetical protein